MPAKIQINRGDIRKRSVNNLGNGQFFWSFINTDPYSSDGHSYSRGQLWIKDPSSKNFTEIADRRSLDSLAFQGYINHTFKGDFVGADIKTQEAFCRCHKGDFWIFKETDKENFNQPFYKGDILLIVGTRYEEVENQKFADKLAEVAYIRIPGAEFIKENSDLEADWLSDAIVELENRLNYKGEILTTEDYFNNLQKKKGNLYIFSNPLYINTDTVILPESRKTTGFTVKVKKGDFIYWNGKKWVLIPSGMKAEDIEYDPSSEAIDSVTTFDEKHKQLLKSSTNVQEALDALNKSKAQLNEQGKVPVEQLPDFIRSGMNFVGVFHPTETKSNDLKDNPLHQNPWPELQEDVPAKGQLWIVDADGLKDVQYQDKTIDGRVLELNSGDFIVWNDYDKRFEVIDNSDQLTGIKIQYPDLEGKLSDTLKGIVTITGEGNIQVRVSGNTIILGEKQESIRGDKDAKGKKDYFSIYKDEHTLVPGPLHKVDEVTISEIGFQVGTPVNGRDLTTYGDMIVRKSPGTEHGTGWKNNSIKMDTFFFNEDENIAERWTKINASARRHFAKNLLEDMVNVFLPEADSTLVGVLGGESLTPNYLTKSTWDGFISETLNSEIEYTDEYFAANEEDGYLNVGYGRTVSEDIDIGEITFYAKSKDPDIWAKKDKHIPQGFWTEVHSHVNPYGLMESKTEHFLNRERVVSRTHLVINPSILDEKSLENFVKMPFGSGTLLLWEDFIKAMGNPGVPLMIPAWEQMHYDVFDFVGLDTSPITIKLNRKAKNWTSVDRENDLSAYYGVGDKSTHSYRDSSKVGSLQDEERGSIDDAVSFNSWVEAQRSIATKEAFILPAAGSWDDLSQEDPITGVITLDPNGSKHNGYGVNKEGGKYQRILPSRSIYKDDLTYYDYHTGALIRQDTTDKDVEMPAVGGVLLTSKSRIDGGTYN